MNLFKKIKLKDTIGPIMLMVITVMVFWLIPNFKSQICMILEKVTTTNESSYSRIGSLTYGFSTFIDNPLIGIKIIDYIEYMDITNTYASFFAVYGFLSGLGFTYIIIRLIKLFDLDVLISLQLFLIILLSSNSHIFMGVQSFWIIMMLGFCIKEKKNENIMDS